MSGEVDPAPLAPNARRGATPFARLRRWAVLLAAAYVGVCFVLWFLQRRLIYLNGARVTEAEQAPAAAIDGLAPWHDEHGQHLGWKREKSGAPTMLLFHGNAGLAADRVRFADGLSRAGWSVHLMEYPGYGGRKGSPSRQFLVDAGCDAVDRLSASGPVYLLGESIGSGVACRVAAARPGKVAGLLLVTPFARLSEVAQRKFPWLPVGLLMGPEDYDNRAALKTFPGPVAFVIAGRDEVVGADQGRSLHESCAGPKQLWEQPAAGHNSLDLNPALKWWAEATAFLRAR